VETCFAVKCTLPEMETGLQGEYFMFDQGQEMPDLANREPTIVRVDKNFDIGATENNWEGLGARDNFAVRWTGQLLISEGGFYEFSLSSDDGSLLYLDGELGVAGAAASFLNMGAPKHIGGIRHHQHGQKKRHKASFLSEHLGLFGKMANSTHESKRNVTTLLGQRGNKTVASNPGVKVVDNNGMHGMDAVVTGSRELTAGPHEIYIEYFEKEAGAGFQLKYKGPDTHGESRVVPDYKLEPPSVTFAGPPIIVGAGSDSMVTSASFPQIVQYTCKHGFTVDGSPLSSSDVISSCNADGQLENYAECQPVKCNMARMPTIADATMEAVSGDLVFGDVVKFACATGYAVEKTLTDKLLLVDTGDLKHSFGVECSASGEFTAPKTCKNVDDCAGHSCGPNGQCVDGIDDYNCNCMPGYEQTIQGNGEKFCGNEDDCGPDACGEHGTCIDLVSEYICECFSGYAPVPVGEADLVCEAKVCSQLEPIQFSSMVMPEALRFPEQVQIECAEGYSIDGTNEGDRKSFHIECGPEGELTPASPCVPIECGFAPVVLLTSAAPPPQQAFVFGQVASYTCEEGSSSDGTPNGERTKIAPCLADGTFPAVTHCMPLDCGSPPPIQKGTVDAIEVFFPGSTTYTCDAGYTLNNDRPAEVSYERQCLATGQFAEIPPGVLEEPCSPGVVPPSGIVRFDLEIETCNTEGADTAAGGTYEFEVGGAWLPAEPLPSSMDRTQVIYTEERTQGWPTKVRLTASGEGDWCYKRVTVMHCSSSFRVLEFGDGPGPDRGNNDHWIGTNGDVATSHEFTVPNVPASIEINFYGARLMHQNLGGQGPDSGVQNTRFGNVGTYDGRPFDLIITAMTPFVAGKSPPNPSLSGKFGEINIRAGTSTDFRFSFEDSESSASVRLDKFEFSFFGISSGGPTDERLILKDFDEYFTDEGYEFEISPATEGRTVFKSTHPGKGCHRPTDPNELEEVDCKNMVVDRLKRAVMFSFSRKSFFDITVESECSRGACPGGRNILFAGRSEDLAPDEDEPGTGLRCVKVSCGEPPNVAHATRGMPGDRKFGQKVDYACLPGYTIDSTPQGLTQWSSQCLADGTYSPGIATACQLISFSVEGKIANAVNLNAVEGATVKVKQGDVEITATTDSQGIFSARGVPSGQVTLEISKDGFIHSEKELQVEGSVMSGSGADVVISPNLPEDGWRVVLTWGKKPKDLDSHVYYGRRGSCHMYYGKTKVKCRSAYRVEAHLDVDDTESYGPETTTFLHLNNCQGRDNCKMAFKVHNYSRRPDWAASEGVVKVYNGEREVATYHVGTDGVESGRRNSRRQFWSVFQLDGSTGTVSPCTTAKCLN